ncbi:MAG: glycerophosphodiester phosphodiesterase [Bacillota bacterium]
MLIITTTLNLAHRGASSLAPENTIIAFDKALEIGADGIEFDVQLSKDSVPVVIHDETLNRTTDGDGNVADFTLAELKALDAGSWFAPLFSQAQVPTLDEVLSRYCSKNLLLNIELKNALFPYPGLEEKVLSCITSNSLEDRVIISSFNYESLLRCRKLKPAVRTGMLYIEKLKEPWQKVKELGCYSAHPLFFYLQFPDIIEGYKKNNIPLYPWTVNDPEMMESLVTAEIEAIITDYPQELAKIIESSRK